MLVRTEEMVGRRSCDTGDHQQLTFFLHGDRAGPGGAPGSSAGPGAAAGTAAGTRPHAPALGWLNLATWWGWAEASSGEGAAWEAVGALPRGKLGFQSRPRAAV